MRATSAACWPPSVRVWISMRSFIDRLVAARIGQTTNFYRDGVGRCRATRAARGVSRLARGRDAPPGRRGAGLPRRADLRASRSRRSGFSPAAGRPRRRRRSSTACSRELGVEDDVLLWNVVPTHPGHRVVEPRTDAARGRRRARLRRRARGGPAGARRRPRRARRARRRVRAPSVARRRDRVHRRAPCSNRHMTRRPAERVAARARARVPVGDGPARRRARHGDDRRRHRRPQHPRPRAGGVPDRRGARRRPCGPPVRPLRPDAGDPHGLRARDRRPARHGRRVQLASRACSCSSASGSAAPRSRSCCSRAPRRPRCSRRSVAHAACRSCCSRVVSGAIWGPLVFGPMFSGRALRRARPDRAVARRGPLHARGPRDLVRRSGRDPRDLSAAYVAPARRRSRSARSCAAPASRPRWSPQSAASA